MLNNLIIARTIYYISYYKIIAILKFKKAEITNTWSNFNLRKQNIHDQRI